MPRSSEPCRPRVEGNQDAVALQCFDNRRSALLEGVPSPQMERPHEHSRWQQIRVLVTETWQQSRRHAHSWCPTCDQLSHVWKTWHHLLHLSPKYAADPAIWQRKSDRAPHSDAERAGGTIPSCHQGTSKSPSCLFSADVEHNHGREAWKMSVNISPLPLHRWLVLMERLLVTLQRCSNSFINSGALRFFVGTPIHSISALIQGFFFL